MGWIPHITFINDISETSDQVAYGEKFNTLTSETKPIVRFEENAGALLKEIRKSWTLNHNEKYYDALSPAYVIGSGIERSLAEKIGANFLAVAFPVSNRVVLNKGYAGFKGGLALVEDLLTQLVAAR